MEMMFTSTVIPIIVRVGPTLEKKDEITRCDRYYCKAKETGKLVPTETVSCIAGVLLRKAAYFYVACEAAIYRTAMLDGCWEGMGRKEKERLSFSSLSPSHSSPLLLTHPLSDNLFLSPIFFYCFKIRLLLRIQGRTYCVCDYY